MNQRGKTDAVWGASSLASRKVLGCCLTSSQLQTELHRVESYRLFLEPLHSGRHSTLSIWDHDLTSCVEAKSTHVVSQAIHVSPTFASASSSMITCK